MLVPISPNNDGGKLRRQLAHYIYNFCIRHKKDLDVNVTFLTTDIVVLFDIYNREGIDAAIVYLDKQIKDLITTDTNHIE